MPVPTFRRRAASLLAAGLHVGLALLACAPAGGVGGRAPSAVPLRAQPAAPVSPPGASDLLGAGAAAGVASAPAQALAQSRARLVGGDYARALEDLGALAAAQPGTAEAGEALFHAAQAALVEDRLKAASSALEKLLAGYPGHPRRGAATLMLGRIQQWQGHPSAWASYAQFEAWAAQHDPGASVADVVELQRAGAAFAGRRVAEGWEALARAAAAAERIPSGAARVRVYEALGARYLEAGNRGQAAAAWRVALDASAAATRPPKASADLALKLAGVYDTLGRRDQADAVRRQIVGAWPRTPAALQAMNTLGPETLPASQRGQVASANGRWSQALEAWTWYLNAGAPEGRAAEARYERALALLRLESAEALPALDRVADQHPESEWAPEALWEAGSLLLRQGNRPATAARFERLAVGYPLSRWRGQALYQLGRLLPALGNVAAGHRYMEAAAGAGYEDFHTFRARAILKRPAPAARPLTGQDEIGPEDLAAWGQWLASRGYAPASQAERLAQLERDPRLKRGTVLLETGFAAEAEDELRELIDVSSDDPLVIAHVALRARGLGHHAFALTLGHRLQDRVRRMGEPSLLAAPRVVQKLVLPLAYWGLVEPAAQAKGVDPLLLLALMKQESWLQPRAYSSASARGLTQFIPATARAVAAELRWPNWTWDDMNRPYVSIPFGAHYLSSLLKEFRGNHYLALAGYNAGPGNVLRWAGGDWNRDVELFVEGITYAETRGYVRSVSTYYDLYRAVYYG